MHIFVAERASAPMKELRQGNLLAKVGVKGGRLLMLSLLTLFCSSVALSQVNFVQITDPHIFDDDWPEDSRLDNHAAFASCISEINIRNKTGADYTFVVVTGDLGIENLVKRVTQKCKSPNDDLVQQSLERGALELGSLLALSKVKQWLFVPGNNDVLDEVPQNIRYYHYFIGYLEKYLNVSGSEVKVVDLCPSDDLSTQKTYASQSHLFQPDKLAGYAFIGFNDASFKNAERPTDIDLYADVQKKSVLQVATLLQKPEVKYAYIFYHIPEIDDPYAVTLSSEATQIQKRVARLSEIGNSYLYSAWFVKKEVRDEWNRVVTNRKVKGLFAGHFHDFNPQSYQGFGWLRTPDYVAGTLNKLHVCPPLALRLQREKPGPARGFQEVHLDENGEVSTRVVWLKNAQWDFGAGDAESARELAVARTLEISGAENEATAAYGKAAESNWPPTRKEALDSLQRLNQREYYGPNKYLLTPLKTGWVTGVNAFGALLFPALLSLGLIIIGPIAVKKIAVRAGKNKLRISPIVDATGRGLGASLEQLIRQVHGGKMVHFKNRVLLDVPGMTFPFLVASQSAEVPQVIEAIVPGGVGKVIIWLRQKSQRPKYEVAGSIQADSFRQITLFVAALGSGETLKRWRKTDRNDRLPFNEVKLAHSALDVVIEEMNNG